MKIDLFHVVGFGNEISMDIEQINGNEMKTQRYFFSFDILKREKVSFKKEGG